MGCNSVCSYCIVPSTRGREVSRPAAELVAKKLGNVTLLERPAPMRTVSYSSSVRFHHGPSP